jgi:hypothetical protein
VSRGAAAGRVAVPRPVITPCHGSVTTPEAADRRPQFDSANTVVLSYTWPGRSTVDGKAGWLGESGKC